MNITNEGFLSQHPEKGHDRIVLQDNLVAVFDGAGNDRASEACVTYLQNIVSKDPEIELGELVHELDETASSSYGQTTMVLARVAVNTEGQSIIEWVNCGDSLLYVVRQDPEEFQDLSVPEAITTSGYIDTTHFLGSSLRHRGDRLNTDQKSSNRSVVGSMEIVSSTSIVLATDGIPTQHYVEPPVVGVLKALSPEAGSLSIEKLIKEGNRQDPPMSLEYYKGEYGPDGERKYQEMLVWREDHTHKPIPRPLSDERDDLAVAILNVDVE
jgi:serine/threonine protein phosphatase PrpC